MLALLASLAAPATAQTCTKTSIGDLAAAAEPGVWVLGERKGTEPDLARARKLVLKLLKKGPVTLALQAVRVDHQEVLDGVQSGSVAVGAMPAALDWENSWGFPFEAYAPLFALAEKGVKLVAIGQDYAPRPPD